MAQVVPHEESPAATKNRVEPAGEAPGDDEPVYRFFNATDDAEEAPAEMHQAVIHFVLHPKVPVLYQLKYFVINLVIISLQTLSILALLSECPSLGRAAIRNQFRFVSDVESEYMPQGSDVFEEELEKGYIKQLDYFMLALMTFVIVCTILPEIEQSKVCELQVRNALLSDDPAVSSRARKWAIPLLLLQKVRQLILIPFTVATVPILAFEEGINALSVALNVVAILFLFDVDDLAMGALLSKAQRAYLEGVSIPIAAKDQKRLQRLVVLLFIAVFFACFFPVWPLYDAERGFFSNREEGQKFAGWWAPTPVPGVPTPSGEPVGTMCLLSIISFGSLYVIEMIINSVGELMDGNHKALVGILLNLLVTGLVVMACVFISKEMSDWSQEGFVASYSYDGAADSGTTGSDTGIAPPA